MKNKFFFIWLAFHSVILLAFLISMIVSPKIHFGTSLFEILPPSSDLREIQEADSLLGNKTSRAITILAKSESFENAKSAAEKFYGKYVVEEKESLIEKTSNRSLVDSVSKSLPNTDFFENLSLYVDSSSIAEISQWLHENRFFLLYDDDIARLENGNAAEIADDTLSSVYGAFTISNLSNLEEDPFLLNERSLERFLKDGALSSTNMTVRDDVLACQKDGNWYVLIRGTSSEKGAALASKKNAVRNIYETASAISHEQTAISSGSEKSNNSEDEVSFIFSGVPFHSYESSTSAQNQISVISTVALILILVVFLWIFRSFVPAFVSASAVIFSCAIGFVSVLLIFRGIHVLTFVFGTTLIGTCLDYSIHFFVNWKGNLLCENGTTVRKHIFRGISLGFLSTEICFLALFFAPFPLLKQVSVFLFTGLATAYLSVVALYPMIKLPNNRSSCKMLRFLSLFKDGRNFSSKIRFVPIILSLASLVTILANYRSLKIQNNIQELYSMSDNMKKNEIESAKVLNTGSSGWYFILKADSEENLLQKNEELAKFLDDSITQKKLGNYLSLAQFVPSRKKQMRSYKAAENLLPLVSEQYENLGFKSDSENLFALSYEKNYRSFANFTHTELDSESFIHPTDSNLPVTIREAISSLWIGEVNGEFYSCVLPLHAESEEEAFFKEYAKNYDGIYFVNKVRDISSQLDILSKTMLKMLGLAFVLVIFILFFCYKPKKVLKIASIPVLVSLVTTAVLILAKIHLSFFPITALVLVFGLGLDYIIYAVEESNRTDQSEGDYSNLSSFAILLSFLTTALSFGALAISTFPPVHFLGLTVFTGLLTAVIGAFCLKK